MSTVVTVSTISCVNARSGADIHKNVRLVTTPTPPASSSATSRWIFRLPGGTERAGRANQPQQGEQWIEIGHAQRRHGR